MVLARDKNIKAHGSTGSSDTGSRYQLCGGMVTQVVSKADNCMVLGTERCETSAMATKLL